MVLLGIAASAFKAFLYKKHTKDAGMSKARHGSLFSFLFNPEPKLPDRDEMAL